MKAPSNWLFLLSTAVGAWQESGENPAIFCYLMMWGATAVVRERVQTLTPAFVRLAACSKPSFTFSMRSTAPTNLPN